MTKRSPLARHGREVLSVFDLVGVDENALTAAFGFVLARSPELLRRITLLLLPGVAPDVEVAVRMETRDDAGRTDLELDASSHLAVVEAKRGWQLPGREQLAAYAPRVKAAGNGVLVTLSDASPAWAAHALPAQVDGVPVRHLGWRQVQDELDAARTACRGEQRFWLDELHVYLRRAIKVRNPADSLTYCVVVSRERPGDTGPRTFRDFVDQGWYFHPFGRDGWPKEPPNFMAFRWDNQVQRVHRVMSAQVVPTLASHWPEIPVMPETTGPYALYELGPSLPGMPVPSGGNYRASRLWVLLDQLLVGPTLADALRATDELLG